MASNPSIEGWARLAFRYAELHGDIIAAVSPTGLLLTLPPHWRSWREGIAVSVGVADSAATIQNRLIAAHAALAALAETADVQPAG